MGLKSESNLDTARTAAQVKFDEVFNGPAPGPWQMFTEVYSTGAEIDNLVFASFLNTIREWLGAKEFGNFEAFTQTIRLTSYEDSFALKRRLVDYDISGAVGRAIAAKITQSRANSDDKIIFDTLVSNSGDGPVAFDGDKLFSTTHTVGGTNYSNKSTSAFSFAEYDTAVQTMAGYKAYNGEPLNISPKLLIVGPKNRKMALQVANADDRVVPVAPAGTLDGTASVNAAASMVNVFRGEVDVIVWNRLTGDYDDYWYLVDTMQPEKPMLLKNERDYELIDCLDMKDPERFSKDLYVWSIEADKKPAAGAWPCMYAGIL